MMKNILIPSVIISLTLSLPSWAKDPHPIQNGWATVTHVEPITRMIEHVTPLKKCWTEKVYYTPPNHHSNSYTSTIMGGIIGGALGNSVGHGKKNKQVGAVVGSLLGASIGHGLSNKKPPRRNYNNYHNQKRCEVADEVSYKEEIVGYHVSYRYKGVEYTTKMSHRPSQKIKVRVSVEPYAF